MHDDRAYQDNVPLLEKLDEVLVRGVVVVLVDLRLKMTQSSAADLSRWIPRHGPSVQRTEAAMPPLHDPHPVA